MLTKLGLKMTQIFPTILDAVKSQIPASGDHRQVSVRLSRGPGAFSRRSIRNTSRRIRKSLARGLVKQRAVQQTEDLESVIIDEEEAHNTNM